jgi:hypothetical protein
MTLTLLDEVPPAGPVPVLGLLRIHGHETKLHGPAALPGPVPDAPFATFVLEIARSRAHARARSSVHAAALPRL